MVHHPFSNRPAFTPFDLNWFDFGTGSDLPIEAIERLRNFSSKNVADVEHGGPIWGAYDAQSASDRDALSLGDPQAVNSVVHRIFGSSISVGFAQGVEAYQAMLNSPGPRQHTGSIILDRFYRLAEAVGATRVRSAEHGQTSIEVEDLDDVFARIEDEVGAELPAPKQDGCLFGLKLRGGLYSERHFDGIYAAWRALETARKYGINSPRICEIGGGGGFVAYYARKLGCRSYAIIDLPQAQIVQYIVLVSAYGIDRVSLETPVRNGIELIAAGSLERYDPRLWDVIINVDSLPEMPPIIAEGYLSNITHGQILLSINQESGVANGEHQQNVVRELASRVHLKQASRSPAWLRTGYVEEVYTR